MNLYHVILILLDYNQHALASMGVSILSGAISTLLASSMLFACSFNFFYLFGSFIFFVILWSLLWAMCFFPAIMMTIGPNNDSGEILWLRKLYGEKSGAPASAHLCHCMYTSRTDGVRGGLLRRTCPQ